MADMRRRALTRCATVYCRATPVLPCGGENEYRELLNALIAEHKPEGPTEEHLVEEMVGVLSRKSDD